MNENERRQESVQQQKAKIRRRYQGIDSEKIHVIPVTVSQPDFDDDSAPKRVAVYARVSTGDPRQTSSYELQKNYYESQVQKHSNWTLVSIYADEGLSGTSTQKRKEFNRMIEDCKAGKIDLILSKSISRFARNYVDCGQIVRELMELNPPVGVRFESENLFTLKMQGEMQLMMFSGIAQEESRIKSNAMNASIEMRFGISPGKIAGTASAILQRSTTSRLSLRRTILQYKSCSATQNTAAEASCRSSMP